MAIQLVTFVLGAVFALLLQFVASRLTLARDQRKEGWIRRLNSYQNFYQHTAQLLDLWRAGVQVPEERVWTVIMEVRKAAYDAGVYDPAHPDLTGRMRHISLELVTLARAQPPSADAIAALVGEAEEIRDDFLSQESQLQLGGPIPRG